MRERNKWRRLREAAGRPPVLFSPLSLFSPSLTWTEMASAAHQDTIMGKMPPQIVTMGMIMKKGVVMAPTTYDQTPEQ
jgi:hypothetical protein